MSQSYLRSSTTIPGNTSVTEKRTIITSSSGLSGGSTSGLDDDASMYYKSSISPRHSSINRRSVSPSRGGVSRTVEITSGYTSGTQFPFAGTSTVTGVSSFKNNREKEKKDLQDLNERFANYIEKVRFLEAQNKKLASELDQLRSHWGKETSNIKSMYETELGEARNLIDETNKEKARLQMRVGQLEEQLDDVMRQLDEAKKWRSQDRETINKLNQQVSELEGEIRMLRRTNDSLDTERQRDKATIARLHDELEKLRIDLSNETIARLDAENKYQTLLEEMEFLKSVHEQELKELSALAYRDTTAENREFWKNELSQAIRDIQQEHDSQVDQIRGEMETFYNLKVQEFRTGATKQNMEVTHAREETKKLHKQLSDSRARLADLEARNAQLEKQYQDLLREMEQKEHEHVLETNELKEEMNKLRIEMEGMLVELQTLMDAKLSLELEIAAYRKLLEGEETRIPLRNSYRHSYTPFSTSTAKSDTHGVPYGATPSSKYSYVSTRGRDTSAASASKTKPSTPPALSDSKPKSKPEGETPTRAAVPTNESSILKSDTAEDAAPVITQDTVVNEKLEKEDRVKTSVNVEERVADQEEAKAAEDEVELEKTEDAEETEKIDTAVSFGQAEEAEMKTEDVQEVESQVLEQVEATIIPRQEEPVMAEMQPKTETVEEITPQRQVDVTKQETTTEDQDAPETERQIAGDCIEKMEKQESPETKSEIKAESQDLTVSHEEITDKDHEQTGTESEIPAESKEEIVVQETIKKVSVEPTETVSEVTKEREKQEVLDQKPQSEEVIESKEEVTEGIQKQTDNREEIPGKSQEQKVVDETQKVVDLPKESSEESAKDSEKQTVIKGEVTEEIQEQKVVLDETKIVSDVPTKVSDDSPKESQKQMEFKEEVTKDSDTQAQTQEHTKSKEEEAVVEENFSVEKQATVESQPEMAQKVDESAVSVSGQVDEGEMKKEEVKEVESQILKEVEHEPSKEDVTRDIEEQEVEKRDLGHVGQEVTQTREEPSGESAKQEEVHEEIEQKSAQQSEALVESTTKEQLDTKEGIKSDVPHPAEAIEKLTKDDIKQIDTQEQVSEKSQEQGAGQEDVLVESLEQAELQEKTQIINQDSTETQDTVLTDSYGQSEIHKDIQPEEQTKSDKSRVEAEPEQTISDKSIELQQTISEKSTEPEQTVSDKTIEPEETIGDKITEPEQTISDKSTEPKQTISDKSTEPEQTISDKSTEPEQTISDKSTEPEQTISDKSTEPEQTIGDKSTEPEQTISDKSTEPEQTIGDKSTEPEQTISDKSTEPEQTIGDKSTEPEQTISDNSRENTQVKEEVASESPGTVATKEVTAIGEQPEGKKLIPEEHQENTEAVKESKEVQEQKTAVGDSSQEGPEQSKVLEQIADVGRKETDVEAASLPEDSGKPEELHTASAEEKEALIQDEEEEDEMGQGVTEKQEVTSLDHEERREVQKEITKIIIKSQDQVMSESLGQSEDLAQDGEGQADSDQKEVTEDITVKQETSVVETTPQTVGREDQPLTEPSHEDKEKQPAQEEAMSKQIVSDVEQMPVGKEDKDFPHPVESDVKDSKEDMPGQETKPEVVEPSKPEEIDIKTMTKTEAETTLENKLELAEDKTNKDANVPDTAEKESEAVSKSEVEQLSEASSVVKSEAVAGQEEDEVDRKISEAVTPVIGEAQTVIDDLSEPQVSETSKKTDDEESKAKEAIQDETPVAVKTTESSQDIHVMSSTPAVEEYKSSPSGENDIAKSGSSVGETEKIGVASQESTGDIKDVTSAKVLSPTDQEKHSVVVEPRDKSEGQVTSEKHEGTLAEGSTSEGCVEQDIAQTSQPDGKESTIGKDVHAISEPQIPDHEDKPSKSSDEEIISEAKLVVQETVASKDIQDVSSSVDTLGDSIRTADTQEDVSMKEDDDSYNPQKNKEDDHEDRLDEDGGEALADGVETDKGQVKDTDIKQGNEGMPQASGTDVTSEISLSTVKDSANIGFDRKMVVHEKHEVVTTSHTEKYSQHKGSDFTASSIMSSESTEEDVIISKTFTLSESSAKFLTEPELVETKSESVVSHTVTEGKETSAAKIEHERAEADFSESSCIVREDGKDGTGEVQTIMPQLQEDTPRKDDSKEHHDCSDKATSDDTVKHTEEQIHPEGEDSREGNTQIVHVEVKQDEHSAPSSQSMDSGTKNVSIEQEQTEIAGKSSTDLQQEQGFAQEKLQTAETHQEVTVEVSFVQSSTVGVAEGSQQPQEVKEPYDELEEESLLVNGVKEDLMEASSPEVSAYDQARADVSMATPIPGEQKGVTDDTDDDALNDDELGNEAEDADGKGALPIDIEEKSHSDKQPSEVEDTSASLAPDKTSDIDSKQISAVGTTKDSAEDVSKEETSDGQDPSLLKSHRKVTTIVKTQSLEVNYDSETPEHSQSFEKAEEIQDKEDSTVTFEQDSQQSQMDIDASGDTGDTGELPGAAKEANLTGSELEDAPTTIQQTSGISIAPELKATVGSTEDIHVDSTIKVDDSSLAEEMMSETGDGSLPDSKDKAGEHQGEAEVTEESKSPSQVKMSDDVEPDLHAAKETTGEEGALEDGIHETAKYGSRGETDADSPPVPKDEAPHPSEPSRVATAIDPSHTGTDAHTEQKSPVVSQANESQSETKTERSEAAVVADDLKAVPSPAASSGSTPVVSSKDIPEKDKLSNDFADEDAESTISKDKSSTKEMPASKSKVLPQVEDTAANINGEPIEVTSHDDSKV